MFYQIDKIVAQQQCPYRIISQEKSRIGTDQTLIIYIILSSRLTNQGLINLPSKLPIINQLTPQNLVLMSKINQLI